MSDDIITTDVPAAKSDKRESAMTPAQFAVNHAKVKGNGDASAYAKRVRAALRSNFDDVCKAQPSLRKVKRSANDNTPWPALTTSAFKAAKLLK